MREPTESLTIGALAKAAEVGVETIRFYQRKALLPEPDRPVRGIRRYSGVEVERVRFIKSAQRLGFSLDEVAELLRLEEGTHCEEARQLAERKLDNVRRKLADLTRLASVLVTLINQCGSAGAQVKCPLIASLHQGEHA
ncbi:Hg(II)-responsive transcriptional regulator [Permianibacter sp. IMCC34836]|uniref:Hg(II)-responsive transcriptional regulator n=1 Tax=Permianibacter fluminis TaxID=2738515 RepID=UPI001556EE35|nr:Hg(II)-responsive transcriptional regulator [Permianibacter fluminis]NQD37981.1 Hg(II)-responsive transcriptional regulator [Permianibacter fluminis]